MRILALTATLAASMLSIAPQPAGAQLLGEASYEIQTEYWSPEGRAVVHRHPATMLVPTPLDATGDGLPDVLVTTTPALSLDGATMQVERLPTAPAPLPLKIEAILREPGDPDHRIAFGYDSLYGSAPTMISIGGRQVGQEPDDSLYLDLSTGLPVGSPAPSDSLALVAQTFKPNSSGGRDSSMRARAFLAKVPGTAHVEIHNGELPRATLSTSHRTLISLESSQRFNVPGRPPQRVHVTVDEVPSSVSFRVDRDARGARVIRYEASDTIDDIDVKINNLRFDYARPWADVLVRVEDLARGLTVTMPENGSGLSFAAEGGAIGLVDAAFMTGTHLIPHLDEKADGVTLIDVDKNHRELQARARVHGLRSFSVTNGSKIRVGVLTENVGKRRRFKADLRLRQSSHANPLLVTGTIDSPPDAVGVTIANQGAGKRIDYSGSDPIGRVELDAANLLIRGAETQAHVRVEGVPRELSLTTPGGPSGALEIHVPSKERVGSLEVELARGDRASLRRRFALDGSGVLQRELADGQYYLLGRVANLRHLRAVTEPAPEFALDASIGRFQADLLNERAIEPNGPRPVFYRADVLRPPQHMTLKLDTRNALQLDLTAANRQPGGYVSFKTNAGSYLRKELSLLLFPIPASLRACVSQNTVCARSGQPRVSGTALDLSASEPVNLSLYDCRDHCDYRGAGDWIAVRDFRFQEFRFDTWATQERRPTPMGHVYLDTDNLPASGHLRVNSHTKVEVELPKSESPDPAPHFRAQDRLVKWQYPLPNAERYGTINCPSGTHAWIELWIDEVRLFGLDQAGYLCHGAGSTQIGP